MYEGDVSMHGGKAVITLVLLIAVMMPFGTTSTLEIDGMYNTSQNPLYNEIWITSDTDFVSQGWPGNGSSSNPFVIADLQIDFIHVKDTRVHFVINNCTFLDIGAISLINVTNGVILNNQFKNSYGIYLVFTSNCQVLNNYLRNSGGIDCDASNFTLIENNTIVEAGIAILLHVSSHSIVRNNTMYRSTYRGIYVMSDETHHPGLPATNNSIYYNNIGCAQYELAFDDGEDNIWDDNVSRGNNWYGYNGSGVVQIDGAAASVDRYPSVFDIDCEAPVLTYRFFNNTSPEGTPPLASFTYEVSVEDPSGVDTVLLYYTIYVGGGGCIPQMPETVFVEMEHQPTTEDPHRYVHTITGPLYGVSGGHYYWANDTMGNVMESPWDRINFGPYKSYFDTILYMQGIVSLMLVVFFSFALVYASISRLKLFDRRRVLQQFSVKVVLPILVFLVPYGITLNLSTSGVYIAYFGAGWSSSLQSVYGQFVSIVGIAVGVTFFFPYTFIIFLVVQVTFIISLSRYYKGLTPKRRTQLWGFIVLIILPLLMNLYTFRFISLTYFSITFILPVPIVYIFGLLLMRYFPYGESENTELR